MQAARDVAQLVERDRDLAPGLLEPRRAPRGRPPSRFSSRLSSSDSAISRCWAPSWRLRSSRCRSFCPASITRAREPCSSSRCARCSACRRPFSSAIPAAAPTAASSSGSSSSAGSWSERRHARAVAVDQRRRPAAAVVGQLDALAVEIGPALELGQPVGERQRRIAQRARERVARGRPATDPRAARRTGRRPPSGRGGRRGARSGTRPARARSRTASPAGSSANAGPSNARETNSTAIITRPSANESISSATERRSGRPVAPPPGRQDARCRPRTSALIESS